MDKEEKRFCMAPDFVWRHTIMQKERHNTENML